MCKIARLKGGKCLGKEYIDQYTPLKWMCEKGHTWDADYAVIKQGGWCMQCLKGDRTKLFLEELKEIAKQKGGECLSDKYKGMHVPLKWKCAKGHVWEVKPVGIKYLNSWCPFCAGKVELNIADMNRIAEEHGGKCLSVKFNKNSEKLKWQCAKGHIWFSSALNIKAGRWCPQCRGDIISIKMRTPYNVFVEEARKHGGKVLTPEKDYVNGRVPMKFECEQGHTWDTQPYSVAYKHSWCPHCAGKTSRTIDYMQEIAEQKGGVCLSAKYTDNLTKLKWRCDKGHVWNATPLSIKDGRWCRVCSKEAATQKTRTPISEYIAIATGHGGKLLSQECKSVQEYLLWECSKGHTWKGLAWRIKKGAWCPFCFVPKKKHSIESMHKLAEEHGGHCLSDEYKNTRTKLKWQCSKGHEWITEPKNVLAGCWCPECRYDISASKTKSDISIYQRLAEKHGGKLLSDKYINAVTPLRWQCVKGHAWMAQPNSIKNMNSWCPICAKEKRLSLKISEKQFEQHRT